MVNICPSENTNATDPSKFLENGQLNVNYHTIGWGIAGVCALISTLITLINIFMHASRYFKPNQQRQIIRILLMIPIYSILSFLSYRYYRSDTYFNLIRNCYEAFAIASFFILLLAYVGDSSAAQKESLRHYRRVQFAFPLKCFSFDASNPHVLNLLKVGVLQYVVIRPLTTLAALILEFFELYCQSSMSPAFGNVYIQIINFISVTVALFALLQVYVIVNKDIANHRPFLKFLAVKLVIFFSFYQAFLVSILAHFGIIKATQYWTTSNIESGLEALAITMEMVIFSLLHFFAYPSSEYHAPPEGPSKTPIGRSLWHALNPVDLVREIWDGVKYIFVCITRRPTGPSTEPGIPSKYDLKDVILGPRGTNYDQAGQGRSRLGNAEDGEAHASILSIHDDKNGSYEDVQMGHLKPTVRPSYHPTPQRDLTENNNIPIGTPQYQRMSPNSSRNNLLQYPPKQG